MRFCRILTEIVIYIKAYFNILTSYFLCHRPFNTDNGITKNFTIFYFRSRIMPKSRIALLPFGHGLSIWRNLTRIIYVYLAIFLVVLNYKTRLNTTSMTSVVLNDISVVTDSSAAQTLYCIVLFMLHTQSKCYDFYSTDYVVSKSDQRIFSLASYKII